MSEPVVDISLISLKTKKLCKIIFFLFCLICFSCQKQTETPLERTNLEGTKWKLVGIVDTKAGDIKELEPRDCEYCYTLTFDTDYTATVYGISQGNGELDLHPDSPSRNLSIDYTLAQLTEMYEKDGEYYEMDPFFQLFRYIQSFTVTNDALKLSYGYSGDSFSLFKRIDE